MGTVEYQPSTNPSTHLANGHPTTTVATKELVVHLVDDDDQFLASLQLQLRSFDLTVEAFHSAECFMATYRPRPVECILLDLRMPGMTGIELQSVLRQRHCCPPIVILSAYAETPEIVRAVQNGAIDYLVKPVDESVLIARVRAALAKDEETKRRRGHVWKRLSRLSEREREVMELFIEAKTTIQIAHLLAISPKTVEKHRANIYEKLEANSIPEVMLLVLDGPIEA
jgi:two-component system response regulator FixJ